VRLDLRVGGAVFLLQSGLEQAMDRAYRRILAQERFEDLANRREQNVVHDVELRRHRRSLRGVRGDPADQFCGLGLGPGL